MHSETAAATVSERTAGQGPSLSLSDVFMRISDTVLWMQGKKTKNKNKPG